MNQPTTPTPTDALRGKKVVVVGGGSGIGLAVARAAAAAGADLLLAGRDAQKLQRAAGGLAGPGDADGVTVDGVTVDSVTVDLQDETSIAALAERAGHVDHLVSTASTAANGPLAELTGPAITAALAAKVTGPLLLAKHLGPRTDPAGSMLFFSGFVAWRPAPQRSVMAVTNGAVAHLVAALAVELAPVRVNAVSPGIVDSGAWDAMGEGKAAFLESTAARMPARRVGTPDDIAHAALFALTNPFTTGTVLHVDGGARLV